MENLYHISELGKQGIYSDKKVDKMLFSFLTEQQESIAFKLLKQKFCITREDISPMQSDVSKGLAHIEDIMQNPSKFKQEIDKIKKPYIEKEKELESIKRQVFKNISSRRHTQAI